MFIQNPPFLAQQPRPSVQLAILLTLLWAALPLGLGLPAGIMLLFCVLLAVRFLLVQMQVGKISLPVIVLLMVASVLLVWQQLGTIIGRDGGISLLLLMIMLKSYEGSSRRDWQVLLLAMLFLIGSSVLLDQSPLTGLWVLLGLLAVCLCFAMLGGLPVRQAFGRSLSALLLTLPLMAVLFVAVPRKNEPLWRIPQTQDSKAKTGLSNTMQPGSISELVQSDEQVANITFSGTAPDKQQMYWRAIIMAEFDGNTWRALPEQLMDNSLGRREATGRAVDYQIVVRDQAGALPALDYPRGALPQGTVMRSGDIIRAQRSREGLRRLSLQASLGDKLPQALTVSQYNFYTHLPGGNERTRQLAAGWAKQSSGDSRQIIQKALDYYRRNGFSYTLQPPKTEGRDGVDAFMFGSKQGFCEHYAQSFVVMMRAAGLPARVVTGYLGGEYFQNGDFWQLRGRDAHAWTEVWLPEEQVWWRVDPTTAVSEVRAAGGIQQALPASEQQVFERGNSDWQRWSATGQYYWQQWVVNYDQTRQNSLLAALGLAGLGRAALLLVFAVGSLLAILPLIWWWRRGRREDIRPLDDGLNLIKQTLLGRDDPKLPGITSAELRQLMADNGMQDEKLIALLQQYESWRYASDRLPAESEQRAWFKQVKKVLKPYRKEAG